MPDITITRTIDFLNAITFFDTNDNKWKVDLRTTLDTTVQRGNFTRIEDWTNAVCTVRRKDQGNRDSALAAFIHVKQD